MKQTGVCPKCAGSEIVRTGQAGRRILTGRTSLSGVRCEQYICSGCGFVEEYIADRAGLEKIARTMTVHHAGEKV